MSSDRTYAGDLEAGEETTVKGWVHEVRDLGGIAFVILRDTSGKIQIKLKDEVVDEDVIEKGKSLNRESVVAVTGTVEEEERAPTGLEILPDSIEVLNEAEPELPLDPSGKVDAELPTRLDNRYLDLRKPEIKAIFEIRAEILDALREEFRAQQATEINTPKIVATATEGGTDLFPMTYFEREAFLNQSPQLFKQMMVGSGLERVFEIGPIFRAEQHNTPRHLNEATSVDFESAFIDDRDAMEICQDVTVAAYERVVEECDDELDAVGVDIEVPDTPFEYLTYDDCLNIANSNGADLEWGDDLTTEAEHAIGEEIGEHYFITDWPAEIKPFYVQENEEDETAKAFDMMHPEMELMSGAQREHRYDRLRDGIAEQGLEPESFDYYLDAFRYGMPPHAGWGLGLERLIMTMLGLDNIREAVLFPRDRQRLQP
ncbi:MAG: aspartate--tRNA(Asn) ligase [Halobacteria archaeon]|nr:aspartate--tRNA(Asn) ligase [Halobacteria archaeon]